MYGYFFLALPQKGGPGLRYPRKVGMIDACERREVRLGAMQFVCQLAHVNTMRMSHHSFTYVVALVACATHPLYAFIVPMML